MKAAEVYTYRLFRGYMALRLRVHFCVSWPTIDHSWRIKPNCETRTRWCGRMSGYGRGRQQSATVVRSNRGPFYCGWVVAPGYLSTASSQSLYQCKVGKPGPSQLSVRQSSRTGIQAATLITALAITATTHRIRSRRLLLLDRQPIYDDEDRESGTYSSRSTSASANTVSCSKRFR